MGRLTTLFDTSVLAGPVEGVPPLGEDCAVSVVTAGELYAGVLLATKDGTQSARLRRLAIVLGDVPMLDVDRAVMRCFGDLRAAAGRLPPNDLWIAATALAHDLTLVTMDERQAALPLVRTMLVSLRGD